MRRRKCKTYGRKPAVRGATQIKKGLCRKFRTYPTEAEAHLWQALRGKRLAGFKFRRQHAIAGYIVDFYCPALHLILEIDGPLHSQQRNEDERRAKILRSLGNCIIRILNEEILSDLPSVLIRIELIATCLAKDLLPNR